MFPFMFICVCCLYLNVWCACVLPLSMVLEASLCPLLNIAGNSSSHCNAPPLRLMS